MEMKNNNCDKLDWEILNALSDDYESVDQIQALIRMFSKKEIGYTEIIERLERLHKNNLVFLTLNKSFDKEAITNELQTKNRAFWFGRTENGYKLWQKMSEKYENNQ